MSAASRLVRVLEELEREGFLLVTDPVLPSVSSLVAGEPVQGSWWSHPASHAIFAVVERLEEGERALLVKLVSKKQTFVHERLWNDFFSIASAKESWQMKGLSSGARSLLRKIESKGSLRLDEITPGTDKKALKKAARDLEERLLAHGKNVHTESGAHEKRLSSWTACARDLRFRFRPKDPASSKAVFEERLRAWQDELGKKATLPWQARSST